MRKIRCILVILGFVTFTPAVVDPAVEGEDQVTVTVDASTEYQIIDGFGGSESWRLPPASLYSMIFDDLGASILRFQMFAYTESKPDLPGNMQRDNDNDDPYVINWEGIDTYAMDKFAPLLQAAQDRGVKIIGTTWSPPAWMKQNNLVESSGWFKSEFKDELVEFILIWVKGMKMFHGVHIDSVTIQNEPDLSPPYPGCRYNKFQIRDIIKLLGARFEREGITTKIHAPDTENLRNFEKFVQEICLDPVARNYVDRLATHPYEEIFTSPDRAIEGWESAYVLASKYGKKIWQTEHGAGNPEKWSSAFLAAQHLHHALVSGKVTAWLTYELYKTGTGGGGLIGESGPYAKFYSLKQYYRYIRPEAIRIECISSDINVMITAFSNPENDSFTLVAINRNIAEKSIRFTIVNHDPISGLDVFRSSAVEKSIGLGRIPVHGNVFTVSLPKESITTLISAGTGAQEKKKGAKIRR